MESEATVTFVGTGSAKSFIHFIIAAILIALLIIALVFLILVLLMKPRGQGPQTMFDLKDHNQMHFGKIRQSINSNSRQRPLSRPGGPSAASGGRR